MKITICDKCGKRKDRLNRVHVYDCKKRRYKGTTTNQPKRDDFDLCFRCRIRLVNWIRFGTR